MIKYALMVFGIQYEIILKKSILNIFRVLTMYSESHIQNNFFVILPMSANI